MDLLTIAVILVVAVAVYWFWFRKPASNTTAAEESVAPYKVEPPVAAEPVPVVAEAKPELKVVNGAKSSRPRKSRPPRAKKPAAGAAFPLERPAEPPKTTKAAPRKPRAPKNPKNV